jgi:hypothetical protein
MALVGEQLNTTKMNGELMFQRPVLMAHVATPPIFDVINLAFNALL